MTYELNAKDRLKQIREERQILLKNIKAEKQYNKENRITLIAERDELIKKENSIISNVLREIYSWKKFGKKKKEGYDIISKISNIINSNINKL